MPETPNPTADDLREIENTSVPTAMKGLVLGADGKVPSSVINFPAPPTQLSKIQHNGSLVASEQIINLIDATGHTFTVADDAANNRVNITPAQSSIYSVYQRISGSSVSNSAAETNLFGYNVPGGVIGTTGFMRLKLLGSFNNSTGAPQDFPRWSFYVWPNSGATTLVLATGSIGSGGGVPSGGFSIWTIEIEMWANGSTTIYVNFRLTATCQPGAAHTSGQFSTGAGQWDVNGSNVYALGSNGGTPFDNGAGGWQFALNVTNFTASPNYQTFFDIGVVDLATR